MSAADVGQSKARKRALDILYAADARGIDPVAVLEERLEHAASSSEDRPAR